MPAIVRKLVILAAADGLLLQPSSQRSQRPIPDIQLQYVTNEICPSEAAQHGHNELASFEAHGIVGLFTVASSSYLISISSRKQVAQVRGKPIYVITGVSLIPLSSQSEAKQAIEQTKESLKKQSSVARGVGASIDSDSSEDEDDHLVRGQHDITDDEDPTVPPTPEASHPSPPGTPRRASQKDSTVAQDVISRRGQYGRFAEKWFSRNGWSVDKKRMQGMSADAGGSNQTSKLTKVEAAGREGTSSSIGVSNDEPQDDPIQPDGGSKEPPHPSNKGDAANTLLPKLLRTTKMLLGSQSFFFSYDYDITRRFGSQETRADLPLYKAVDPLYFWNKHLATSFVDAGRPSFVLPLMQGFVGQRGFTVNTESNEPARAIAAVQEDVSEIIELQDNAAKTGNFKVSAKTRDFLITLISRRSIMRPGLRYLRRGVDDEGHTANSVETEQILSSPSWNQSDRIHSFTQIRGSMPLYFSQSPYSFKPVPVLQHSPERNHAAFKRHFTNIVSRYGNTQIVLLVDKQGGEAKIGEQYEEHTKQLNEENGINGTKLDFEWFDFHKICRGMKFENVSLLMDTVGPKLDEFGDTIEVNGKIQTKQSGVLRTNCMDCLDRTNVVQSACGQRALEQQLQHEGIAINLQTDTSTQWFNTLWADNGDAISKQYSSTAALKGDYTRTRKRDYRGAINDFGLTLSRYFNNIVNDYFSQAAIDYLLGNVTDQVFEEFEADMMSGDPATSMQKVRQNAIDTSSKIVIADQSEELLGGWTLLCPLEPNTVRTFPFEEAVLLLTDAALYAVRFDWNMEKVSSFERVDLRSITGIVRGTYITSTLAAAQTDEQRNVGFIVKYRPGKEDIARVNTRSLSTAVALTPDDSNNEKLKKGQQGADKDTEHNNEENNNNTGSEPVTKNNNNTTKEDPSQPSKLLAFKALPARSSLARSDADGHDDHQQAVIVSEIEFVRSVCEEIGRAVGGGGGSGHAEQEEEKERKSGVGAGAGGDAFIEERDIISLVDARKSTGLLEQWGHSLKKLVWA